MSYVMLINGNSLNRLMTEQTPQSFYWIGFLIADGSFHSGGKFELGLAEKDLGVIEAFNLTVLLMPSV